MCGQLLELSWAGQHLPMIFPPSLRWLKLDMSFLADRHDWKLSRAAADDLMARLAKLPDLQDLTLHLGTWGHLPSVHAQHLPGLQRLDVRFMVADLVHPQLSMGCRWLRAQSCPELRMHATLGPASYYEADLVMKMNGLHMHHIHLEQQLWAKPLQEGAAWCSLKAAQRVILTLASQETHTCLPSAPELHLKLQTYTHLHWKALLKAGRRVMIQKGACDQLRLFTPRSTSRAQQLHDYSAQPWQITILPPTFLRGLPPSLPSRPGTYFWQNEAAVSAGWQQPDAWD